MATTFDTIASFVRPVLGDSDTENWVYSQDAIFQHIRLWTMTTNDPELQEDASDPTKFTRDLTPTQKAVCIFSVAKGLLSPVPNFFAYRTPVQSGTRSGATVQLLTWIEEQLGKLNGGFFPISSDDELHAILLGPQRFLVQFNDVLSKLHT